MTHLPIYTLILSFVLFAPGNAQNKTNGVKPGTKDVITSNAPNGTIRKTIQDRKENIWIAAFDGVFRYDGKSFTNITGKVTSSRFFSVLEDRKGNFWFGSMGSGAYYYDGKSLHNFTTKEGLVNNEIGCIYQGKAGNIWFGANGGASRYDGKTFQNYTIKGEVNDIVEDKTGKFWFGTRGNTFLYDGKTFTPFTHDGHPFNMVRSIVNDDKGNIWLAGPDGLWRYDGNTFTNFIQGPVLSVYQDKKGNIWTGSQESNGNSWALSRYDAKSLSEQKPTAEVIFEFRNTLGNF